MKAGRILLSVLLTLASVAAVAQTTIRGLRGPVTVATPPTGVPSIIASNEIDAAFMQGYIQARDRFFQMDLTRRLASGTLAELVGPSVLPDDIQLRTLGLRRAAWESWAGSSQRTRAIALAYSNGVNAWLNANALPLEYGLLEITDVAPWSPVDSFVVGKALAFQLSFSLSDLDATVRVGTYQAVGAAVGFDGLALFSEDTHRAAPADDRVTVPGFLASIGGFGKSESAALPYDDKEIAMARGLRDRLRANPLLKPAFEREKFETGSNWWLASGSVTASGAPLLANDPHLTLDTPSTFVAMHVAVQDDAGVASSVSGVSVPGVPGIVQGCNMNLCWGSTVNPIDDTDLYFDQVLINNYGLPTHTLHGGVAEPVIWIFQTYFFNNVGDGVADNVTKANIGLDAGGITFVVPRRNNGPVLDLDGTQVLTAQYTGWGATLEIEAFLEAGDATDVFEFGQALTKFDFGSQNFGVADTSGNIAYYAGAELPVREDLQNLGGPDGGIPPTFIRDGSGALAHEWLPVQNPQPNQAIPFEILPASEMPHSINPDSGYIVNANNDPVGNTLDNNPFNQLRPGGGLYYLNGFVYSGYRVGRIDRLMQDAIAQGPLTADHFKAFQANNQMLDAELITPHIATAFLNAGEANAWPAVAALAADPRVTVVMDLFSNWDFSSPTGIPAGYDPGDDPLALGNPSDTEVRNSVAAAVYSGWRGQMIQNVIDGTLAQVGLSSERPGSTQAINALQHHLDTFAANQGIGASGLNFFNVPDAPDAESARDFIILKSLVDTLDLFASDSFASAFGGSADVMDYRWGRLHRIVLDHPLADDLSLPTPQGLYGFVQPDGLRGAARSGGYEVLDASAHSTRADGPEEFRFGAGPARRFVGELAADGIVAEQILPGGRSGVFGDPAYANQLYLWLVNGYLPLLINPDVALAVSPDIEVFEP